jgi:hypothetical protein
MTPNRATPDQPPAACAGFVALVQRFLDGELDPAALEAHRHTATCLECRALAAAARALSSCLASGPGGTDISVCAENGTQTEMSVPLNANLPPGLADRITAAAMRDYRVRRRRRRAALTLAASVVIAGAAYLLLPANADAPAIVQSQPPAPEAPRVADRVADAGDALAALTRHAADQTVAPARHLVPPAESVSWPSAELPPVVDPAVESLAEMPDAARSGFEPMANTTRRAVNLFLRDVGFGQADKPRS